MPLPSVLPRALRNTASSVLHAPAAAAARSSRPVALSRAMASTPDSSHVSEHTVHAPAGTTPQDAHGAHHEDHYEPPTGWLWGIPPGEQYKKEGWEGVWYWGFCGSLLVAAVAYAGKPDTNIETWALEEAKRRLQAEGILPEDK